jgi:protein phosphatase
MITNLFYLNEQGKRKNIEDAIFPKPNTASINDKLFIVCDGVGGQAKGEEASRIACEAISESIYSLGIKDIQEHHIHEAVLFATAQMQQYISQHPEAEQMSTTLTMAFINGNDALVAWCGDSRIYHIRKGKVLWQSKDHSLVQQLVDLGEISKEEALNHPKKNIIIRSLNAHTVSKTDVHRISNIVQGDYILLCTDGILENIDDQALMSICGPQQINTNKTKLFLDHCEGKTQDNFSMYLLQLSDVKKKPNSIRKTSLVIIVFLLILLGAFMIFYHLNNINETEKTPEKTTPNENSKNINKDDNLLLKLNPKTTNKLIKRDSINK